MSRFESPRVATYSPTSLRRPVDSSLLDRSSLKSGGPSVKGELSCQQLPAPCDGPLGWFLTAPNQDELLYRVVSLQVEDGEKLPRPPLREVKTTWPYHFQMFHGVEQFISLRAQSKRPNDARFPNAWNVLGEATLSFQRS
jgi:hypothetical protein